MSIDELLAELGALYDAAPEGASDEETRARRALQATMAADRCAIRSLRLADERARREIAFSEEQIRIHQERAAEWRAVLAASEAALGAWATAAQDKLRERLA